jgi:hypothetical protein
MQGDWIRLPQAECSIIFIHGILSSGEACWLNQNGCYWPNLLASDPALQGTGIYVYTYQTDLFSGNYRLSDVVDDLKERTKLDRVTDCKKLLFVCHSMGGIIVRKFLVERAMEFVTRDSEVGLFLLASPSLGASYADMLSVLARSLGSAQADALRFVRNNFWLNDLDKEFMNLKESRRINIVGKELIEDKFVFLRRLWRRQVVEPFSGARYFGEPYKVPKSDHFSIAKPSDDKAIQHRLLCGFIREMGISEAVEATPDKVPEAELLANLTAQHPFLAAAQSEIENGGISNALAASLLGSGIAPPVLADFYLIMARRVSGMALYGVALCALEIVNKFDVGHSVLDYCLEDGRLEREWRNWIAVKMAGVDSESAVTWCHKVFTTNLRYDAHYNTFLQQHVATVALKDSQRMIAYLLHPNRGPAGCNVDSFYLAIQHVEDPTSLLVRWKEWIRDGRFDGDDDPRDETAEVLYRILNNALETPAKGFEQVVLLTHEHVRYLLKSKGNAAKGFYHLINMLDARYERASDVFEGIIQKTYGDIFSPEEKIVYKAVSVAFRSLIKSLEDPLNKAKSEKARDDYLEVAEVDNVSGMWVGSKRFPEE